MNYDQYMNLVRAGMNMAGGAMAASGIATGSGWTTVLGLVPNIAAIAWGIFVHSPAQVVKAADEVKARGLA